MTRVFILAESTEAAESLAELIADDDRLEVAGAVPLSEASKADVIEAGPDVLLVSHIAVEHVPKFDIPVVVLTDEPFESWDSASAIKARLPLQITPGEAFAALIAAAKGLTLLTSAQAEIVLHVPPAPKGIQLAMVEHLTPREREVLLMMAQGSANKEIADQLRISENTVKFHVASILGKLDAVSRTEAVAIGMRRGLIPI